MIQWNSQFGRDERGFIVSSELVLISSLCVVGLMTGLTCLRNAVNAEFTDVAQAIGSLNQSYSYTGQHGCTSVKCGVTSYTRGSFFTDLEDGEQSRESDLDAGVAPEVTLPPVVAPGPVVVPQPAPVLPAAPLPSPGFALPSVPYTATHVYPEAMAAAPLATGAFVSGDCACTVAPLATACECAPTCVAPLICPPAAPCCDGSLFGTPFSGSRVLVW